MERIWGCSEVIAVIQKGNLDNSRQERISEKSTEIKRNNVHLNVTVKMPIT